MLMRQQSQTAYTRPTQVLICFIGVASLLLLTVGPTEATPLIEQSRERQQWIRILGTTFTYDRQPVGVVVGLRVGLEQRDDRKGLTVVFETLPGHFSPASEAAVLSAIIITAKAAHLQTETWSVTLTVPHHGLTIYGNSLSAMVGLAVVALARGDAIPADCVITGTVTADGRIGTVGGIPFKLSAAHQERLRLVLIPEEYDIADGDWQTPFLMQVSPVATVHRAYQALTGRTFAGEGS